MSQKLIILRGNSGSGKSTIAKKLQSSMGNKTLLVPQDVVRREMLRSKDEDHNLSTQLIYELAMYGKKIGFDVIVEGILVERRYGDMLRKLIDDFGTETYVYYFDITFEETLRRHMLKPAANDFGETEMRQWWRKDDYLGFEGEKKITDEMSEDQIFAMIMTDIL
jgi:predicted kinase